MLQLTLHEFWVALGGVSAVVIGISTWFSKLIADRINNKWKTKADKELEEFKSELAKSQAMISGIYTQYVNGYHHGQERRIKSIDILWSNLRPMSNVVDSLAGTIYNILSRKELKEYWNRKTDSVPFNEEREKFSNLKHTDIFNSLIKYNEPIELERPFLGEKIFAWYNFYKIFLGRISYLIITGAQNKNFIHWQDDNALVHLLQTAFAKKEFDYLMLSEFQGYQILKDLFEVKLLAEINQVISGHAATESALEIVQKYQEAQKGSKNN